MREDITHLPAPEVRLSSRAGKLHVLVLGGSLGAKPINDLFPSAIKSIAKEQRPIVWHQAGPRHVDSVKNQYCDVEVEVTIGQCCGSVLRIRIDCIRIRIRVHKI